MKIVTHKDKDKDKDKALFFIGFKKIKISFKLSVTYDIVKWNIMSYLVCECDLPAGCIVFNKWSHHIIF